MEIGGQSCILTLPTSLSFLFLSFRTRKMSRLLRTWRKFSSAIAARIGRLASGLIRVQKHLGCRFWGLFEVVKLSCGFVYRSAISFVEAFSILQVDAIRASFRSLFSFRRVSEGGSRAVRFLLRHIHLLLCTCHPSCVR